MAHHTGYVVAGRLHVEMRDGSVMDVGPNEVFDIPPGHDGWVISDEPWLAVNWAGFRSWVPGRTGERVLLTILFTDLVGSTERAVSLGDREWRDVLARHYRSGRVALDRYRGREVDTAGDGFLAVFDGAGRAIDAASAIREAARKDRLHPRRDTFGRGRDRGRCRPRRRRARGVADRCRRRRRRDPDLRGDAHAVAGGAFTFDAVGRSS